METIFAPLSTLRFEANLTHTRAVLSAPIPLSSTLAGDRGDRLPYAPLWSGSIAADYTRALLHGWIGTVGADWRYTGQRYTAINNPGNCPINCAGATRVPTLMPYGVADMHAGVSNDQWSVRLSVRNITNKYALVDVNGGGARLLDLPPIIATVLSGRLFTLGAEYRF
jgi:outer membrane receptor protein involved in Fe transport